MRNNHHHFSPQAPITTQASSPFHSGHSRAKGPFTTGYDIHGIRMNDDDDDDEASFN
jgi:hypothetical protein